MKADLGTGVRVEVIDKERYDAFRLIHEPKIFPNRYDINAQLALSTNEKDAVSLLGQRLGQLYDLRLGFFEGDEMIGWSYGIQVNAESFRMVTTGIVPEFQGKKIYSRFLSIYAEHIKQQGFQILFSRHYATNNQVIVPKLRFGFLISGFEISDQFGLLLWLSYYFNSTRQDIMHVRSGFQQPDVNINKLVRQYD
ncbi:MAG: hypothetical protein K2X93_07220 [Candidatus Obscuribacterales bacterium]|nr:hypothetical protein [Candidatus Obscuribacterales bacterium]